MPAPSRPVVFVHINKNGGTTIWNSFSRMFGKDRIRRFAGPEQFLPENARAMRQLIDTGAYQTLRVFGGHFYCIADYTAQCPHFTLLREPVDRVISKYYQIRRSPDHFMREIIGAPDMTPERGIPLLLDNDQVRYIANVADRPVTRDDLEVAKQRLEHEFAAFGLLERYNESLILFKRAFDWPMPYYTIQNEGANRGKHIPDEVRRIAAETNALDIELYTWAQALFEQRIAAQPPEYQRDLQRFERLLPLWQRWHTLRGQTADRARRLSKRARGKIRYELKKITGH